MAKTAARKKKPARVNKTAAILEYQESHPEATATEIAKAVSRKGMEVKPTYVSTVLYNYRQKKGSGTKTRGKVMRRAGTRGRKRKTMVARKSRKSVGEIRFTEKDVMLAKKLVNQTGSAQAARKALDFCINIMA